MNDKYLDMTITPKTISAKSKRHLGAKRKLPDQENKVLQTIMPMMQGRIASVQRQSNTHSI